MVRNVDMTTGEPLPLVRGMCSYVPPHGTKRCGRPAWKVIQALTTRGKRGAFFTCDKCEADYLKVLIDEHFDVYAVPWYEREC